MASLACQSSSSAWRVTFLWAQSPSLHRRTGILVMAPHAIGVALFREWLSPPHKGGKQLPRQAWHLVVLAPARIWAPDRLQGTFSMLLEVGAWPETRTGPPWGHWLSQGSPGSRTSYVFIESSRPRARMDWRGTFWLGLALRSLRVSLRVGLLRPIKLSLIC
jgi:hypothetical protein